VLPCIAYKGIGHVRREFGDRVEFMVTGFKGIVGMIYQWDV